MNFEKWGKVSKYITVVTTTFFLLVVLYGVYLGVTGEQEFTFSNSQDNSAQQVP